MDIKNNSLVIVNSKMKNDFIKNIRNKNSLIDIKFLNENEFIKKAYFDYDEKTIYYIISNYHVTYEIAVIYLKNMYYVIKSTSNNPKIIFLKNLYQELKDHNLLDFDKSFKKYMMSKNIYLYHTYNDLVTKYLLDFNYIDINDNNSNYELPKVFEFDKIEEEVEYVFIKIIELLNEGIDINHIKISGIDESYYASIKRLEIFYHLKIEINDDKSLYETSMGLYFLNNLTDNLEVLDKIKEKYDLNNENNLNIYNAIISVINNYPWTSNYLDIKELLVNAFKNKKLKAKKYKKSIEVVDFRYHAFNKDDYVFILGFNLNNTPKIYKDEEYLPDNLKKELGYDTQSIKNIKEKKLVIDSLKKINNLTITYKLKDNTNNYYPSSLINDLKLEVEKINNNNYSYSNLANKIKLSKYLDEFYKYHTYQEDINLLYSTYPNLNYLSYDNGFTGIDKDKLKMYKNNRLTLSYSSLNNYYLCPFKYYLTNVLKLEKVDDTFKIDLGNLFHKVLSHYEELNFDIDKYYDISNITDKREKFFYLKLKKELDFIIKFLKEQREYFKYDKALYEEEIKVNLKDNITFKGYIDKMLIKKIDEDNYASIIDYKTGNIDIDLRLLDSGLNMQLPIYIYLLKHSKYKDYKLFGIYLEHLLNYDKKAIDITREKKDKLKLTGYTINNKEVLENIDLSYADSKVIKNLKVNKDGSFSSYAKLLSEQDFKDINLTVEDKINTAIKDIKNGNFVIKPKIYKGENISCKYCQYKDICYVKEEDKEIIN